MSSLIQDVRYALRLFRKNPGFTAVAALSLALGIGANSAIFALVDAVLLKWLPVKSPEQLYVVATSPPNSPGPRTTWNYPDYAASRDRSQSFQGLIAYNSPGPMGFSVKGEAGERTELGYGLMVSGNYFQVLGVDPALGRALNAEDDRAPGASPYAVLSYDFWKRRFGGDPRVIGRGVNINNSPFTIVGVARSGFAGVEIGVVPDFFIPIMMRGPVTGNPNWNNRHHWWLTVMGRLRPGVPRKQVEAELYVIQQQQEQEERRAARDQRFVSRAQPILLLEGSRGHSSMRNRLSQPLFVLMTIVGLVLLIACANVANLLLARAAARQREIAVRLAVGAGRRRLVSQLLVESVLLSLMGGVAGLVLSLAGVRVLLGFVEQASLYTRATLEVTPDVRLLGFTILVSLLTGVLFGLAPAVQATRADLVPALKDDTPSVGRSRFSLRKGLVVVQVSLSLLLLIGTGMFVRSLRNLRDLDAGFRRDHLLLVQIDPTRSGYNGRRTRDFYDRLRDGAESLPGVMSASLANITPLGGSQWNDDVNIEGYQWKEGEPHYLDMNAVGPRFFETLGIPILLGRDFRPEDSPAITPERALFGSRGPRAEEQPGPRVLIVNQSLADHFFPGQSPIGRRICLGENFRPEFAYEIVGVVKDARYFGLRRATESMIYMPVWRPGAGGRTLCLRTGGDPKRLIEAVRREAQQIDNAIPILAARTMEEQVDTNILQEKFIATLSSFFGLLALLLASVGLYGVMAHAVTRRTREIGIRMALGAERGAVLWLILRDALVLVGIGVAVGIPAALALTRLASAFLYGIGARDPVSMVAATAVLLGVAALASYLPARRATKVDPIRALRYE